MKLWEQEPDFVNDKGIKWWRDDDFNYLTEKLPKSAVFLVEFPDGVKEWVITYENKPIYNNQSAEAICCYFELFKIIEGNKAKKNV